ncbi:MAG TPA: phage terminase large subunit [bacterium]|nr:phage terminase large subunit [bacterium]
MLNQQKEKKVLWTPHPGPQEEVLTRTEFEILYGGARGGGKTDAGIVWLTDYILNPKFRALVIRRNADDLSDWVDRASRMYAGLGVNIAYRPAILRFPSGAIIRTGHLKDELAYTKYQGHEYQRMLIEELTQIPSEKRYMQLISSCRSTVPELKPEIFMTTNPGGVGHSWVKKRFIDPSPPNVPFKDPSSGRTRIFIPAKVDDNPTLIKNDPDYVAGLEELRVADEQLYKAWRLGSWDVFIGQVFTEFNRDIHVNDRLDYPIKDCIKIIGFDWGYNDPGCAEWLAIAPENKRGVRRLHFYREIYRNGMRPKEWASELSIFAKIEDTDFLVLPHDCFSAPHGARTIASIFQEVFRKQNITTRIVPGNTLAKGARINRVALMHEALSISPDNKPHMYMHPDCSNLIRTLPELVHDEVNVEDVNSNSEDHAYDAASGALLFVKNKWNLLSGSVKMRKRTAKPSPYIKPLADGTFSSRDFMKEYKRKIKKRSHV